MKTLLESILRHLNNDVKIIVNENFYKNILDKSIGILSKIQQYKKINKISSNSVWFADVIYFLANHEIINWDDIDNFNSVLSARSEGGKEVNL